MIAHFLFHCLYRLFLQRLLNWVMNSLRLSQNSGQVKNSFWRKYHVGIKTIFWNGCCSYLSLLKPPSKTNINSWISKNIGVQKTALSKVALQSYQIHECMFLSCHVRVSECMFLSCQVRVSWVYVLIMSRACFMSVCSYHFTYVFQSESTLSNSWCWKLN